MAVNASNLANANAEEELLDQGAKKEGEKGKESFSCFACFEFWTVMIKTFGVEKKS